MLPPEPGAAPFATSKIWRPGMTLLRLRRLRGLGLTERSLRMSTNAPACSEPGTWKKCAGSPSPAENPAPAGMPPKPLRPPLASPVSHSRSS